MIKELILYNIVADKTIEEINKVLGTKKSGKILKVFVKFAEDVRSDVHLRILTREGEEVLNIHNLSEKGNLFYPRVSTASGKYELNRSVFGSDNNEYIYFLRGLLINVKKNNPMFEGVLIEKIRIVYQTI